MAWSAIVLSKGGWGGRESRGCKESTESTTSETSVDDFLIEGMRSLESKRSIV